MIKYFCDECGKELGKLEIGESSGAIIVNSKGGEEGISDPFFFKYCLEIHITYHHGKGYLCRGCLIKILKGEL